MGIYNFINLSTTKLVRSEDFSPHQNQRTEALTTNRRLYNYKLNSANSKFFASLEQIPAKHFPQKA